MLCDSCCIIELINGLLPIMKIVHSFVQRSIIVAPYVANVCAS